MKQSLHARDVDIRRLRQEIDEAELSRAARDTSAADSATMKPQTQAVFFHGDPSASNAEPSASPGKFDHLKVSLAAQTMALKEVTRQRESELGRFELSESMVTPLEIVNNEMTGLVADTVGALLRAGSDANSVFVI